MHGVNAFGAFIRCRTTHGYLLLGICNDKSVTTQLHSRFLNFFKSCYQSDNYLVTLCSRLTAYGSRSAISDTSCLKSDMYGIDRHDRQSFSLILPAATVPADARIIRDSIALRDSGLST